MASRCHQTSHVSACGRRVGVLALLLSFAFAGFESIAAAPRTSNPREPVSLQLKWYHQFQFAGYHAAQAKGYYAQENLDVTIIEGDAQHPPIQEVLAGRAQFGVSDADLVRVYLEGKPVVVLAAVFQHSPYILMSRADRGIRRPSDLRGKEIMLSDEQGNAQLRALLRREGMSLKDIRIVPHQWNNDLLIRGEIDAISAYSTVEPFQLRAKGVEPAMIRAMDYGVDFYGDTLFTTRKMVEEKPRVVEAMRRASLRGWEYAMSHPEEIADLILQMPGVRERGVTREMLLFEADAMRDLLGFVQPGHMNPGRWQAIGRTYAEVGLLRKAPTEADLEGFIYSPDPQRREQWIKPLLLSLGLVLLVATWVLVWNVQLRRSVARRTAALEQAEQELRYHVGNSPLGVIEWDAEFRVRRWSGRAEQMFGWRPGELLGKSLNEWRFIHEADQELCGRVVSNLLSGREKRNVIRNRNYRKDGSVVDCEWYNSAAADENGKIRSIFSLVLDVTARARAEEALRESEERFRLFMDHSPTIAWVKDDEGRYAYMSRGYERRFKVSLSECRGKTDEELWPAEVAARLRDGDRAVLVSDGPIEMIEETTETDGSRSYWLNNKFPFQDSSGQRFVASIGLDITPRKQAEEALRQSEEKFRAVFEQAAIGIGRVSFSDACWIDANDAFSRMLGYSRDELVGKPWPEITHPADVDADLLPFGQMAAGQLDTYTVEKRFLHKRGHAVWARLALSVVRDQGGRPDYEIAVIEDITERKQAETALSHERAFVEAVLQACPAGIIVAEPGGKLVRMNPANRRLWGMAPFSSSVDEYEEWKGWWADGSERHGRRVEPHEWALARALKGEVCPGDIVEIEPFGMPNTRRTMLNSGAPVLGAKGEILGAVIVQIDITARVRAEEALRESEQHFRALAESVPQLVWRTSAEGSLEYINEQWSRHTGQTLEEARGSGWTAALHPDDLQRTLDVWNRATATGEVYQIEYRLRSKEGEYRWFLARGMPLRDGHGRIHGWFGTSTDIDEQRRMLEALQESEQGLVHMKEQLSIANEYLERRVQERTAELRATIAELEQMSYSMIHDLRAPLRAIQSFGQIVSEETRNHLTDESRDLIGRMMAATDRMDHLVCDMLNYGRVIRGELPLGPVDVTELVRGIVDTYPNIRGSGADIRISPMPWVIGNHSALTQCMAQLIGNAVKFRKPAQKPVIIVRSERVETGSIRILVEDNGVGIPPDYRDKLFGMFQRLGHPGEGTGMGLAIVKKAVERMGGRVGVDSRAGEGSRFWVELKPADQGREAEEKTSQTEVLREAR